MTFISMTFITIISTVLKPSLRWVAILLPFLMYAAPVLVVAQPVTKAGTETALSLPPVFTDHMVLQRDQDIPVWGKGQPGRDVSVSLNNESAVDTTVLANGRWQVMLPTKNAGGPYVLTVQSEAERIEFKDVFLGDVWLMAGQSNMAFRFRHSALAEQQVALAALPNLRIRLLEVPKVVSGGKRQERPPKPWQVASASAVSNWSAVALHFALGLQPTLKDESSSPVAVGMINSSQGASLVEAWMTPESLELAGGETPQVFTDIRRYYRNPSVLQKTMLASVQPYAVKGVVWYQGESNAARAGDYEKRLSAMITGWRSLWQTPDLPFLVVQLPIYQPPNDSSNTKWAELRSAQAEATRSTPNAWLSVTIDTGDKDDVHPVEKKTVGDRLVQLARAMVYGHAVPYRGPEPSVISYRGSRAEVSFRYAEGGLSVVGNEPPAALSVLGSDDHWQPAEASVKGNIVVVQHPQGQPISGVRHAWSNAPTVNLYNAQGFPVEPFEDRQPRPNH